MKSSSLEMRSYQIRHEILLEHPYCTEMKHKQELEEATNESLLCQLGHDTVLLSYAEKRQATVRQILSNKRVLLLFSSSWCGPCKRFTPLLKKLYYHLKAQGREFEVVFLSSDMLLGPYEEYASRMPWWCLPLQQSTIVQRLSTIYKTSGIPHLVALDADGTVVHSDAVPLVKANPTACPWRPCRVVDMLPEQYLQSSGETASFDDLDQKYLLIYVATSQCPPCRRLTPLVKELYQLLKAQRNDFEFLYLSSDRDEAEFNAYWSTMGFAAFPYHERQTAIALKEKFQIQCLPTLFMLGPKGCDNDRPLLNRHVRDLLWQCNNHPTVLVPDFPFASTRNFGDLNQISENIHETKCIVVFCEACDDDEQKDIQRALQCASQLYRECDAVKFYWACEQTQLTTCLRETLALGPPQCVPSMVLLDLASNASYYVGLVGTDLCAESILDFVRSPGTVRTLC